MTQKIGPRVCVTLTVQSMAALCRGGCNPPTLIEGPFYSFRNCVKLFKKDNVQTEI